MLTFTNKIILGFFLTTHTHLHITGVNSGAGMVCIFVLN